MIKQIQIADRVNPYFYINQPNNQILLQYDIKNQTLKLVDLYNNIEKQIIGEGGGDIPSSDVTELIEDLSAKIQTVSGKLDEISIGVFKFQGSCTEEELQSKEKIEGHVWQVEDKEFAYNGNEWVELGFNIDLSNLAEKADTLSGYGITDAYTKDEADQKFLTDSDISDLALSSDVRAEFDSLNIPTKTSELTNDSEFITTTYIDQQGFIKEHQSLSSYYTKDEIDNKNFLTEQKDPKFAALSGSFALKDDLLNINYNDLTNKPIIPTSTSQLENDVGFLTEHQDISNLAKKSEIPTKVSELDNDNGFITGYTETDPVFAEVSGLFANEEKTETNINYLITKLSKVIKEVDALKRETNVTINTYNPQIINSDNGTLSISDSTVDAIVTSEEITERTEVITKSLEIDNSTIELKQLTEGVLFKVNAIEDVAITNTEFSSDTIDKSVDLIYVTSAEVFKLDGINFSGRTYNTIMTGQGTSGKYLKYADITNCTFNEDAKHINIWFAGWQDNAVLNIKNCTFKSCEQFLCLGDFHAENGNLSGFNNKLTINIENCEIETYENAAGDQYSGIILCDSRQTTGALSSQFATLNPFGNGKVTINIKNVTVGGVKLTKDNFLMGTKDIGQMLYVYQDAGKKNYDFNETNESLFPTVYVDGELIYQLA